MGWVDPWKSAWLNSCGALRLHFSAAQARCVMSSCAVPCECLHCQYMMVPHIFVSLQPASSKHTSLLHILHVPDLAIDLCRSAKDAWQTDGRLARGRQLCTIQTGPEHAKATWRQNCHTGLRHIGQEGVLALQMCRESRDSSPSPVSPSCPCLTVL